LVAQFPSMMHVFDSLGCALERKLPGGLKIAVGFIIADPMTQSGLALQNVDD